MKRILKLRPKTKLILAVTIVLVVILVSTIYFGWQLWKSQPEKSGISSSEELKPGTIGEIEIKEGETKKDVLEKVNPEAIKKPIRPINTVMPSTVFDTKAEILSISSDKITVEGTGENFEDQIPRILVIKYIDITKTFISSQKLSFEGLEGLKYLNVGEKILISSFENIRGKTEFSASYINKI